MNRRNFLRLLAGIPLIGIPFRERPLATGGIIPAPKINLTRPAETIVSISESMKPKDVIIWLPSQPEFDVNWKSINIDRISRRVLVPSIKKPPALRRG